NPMDMLSWKKFLGNIPVISPCGPLRGLRWTLHPCTSYWRGTHEPLVVRAFEKSGPKKGDAVWDIGAHFGFYSFWFAKLVGPTGEITAFEPNPEVFAKLQKHHRLNFLPYIKIFQTACGDQDGLKGMIDASE